MSYQPVDFPPKLPSNPKSIITPSSPTFVSREAWRSCIGEALSTLQEEEESSVQDIFSSSMAKHLGVQVLPAAEIDPTPCVYFSRETNEGSGLDELQAITAAEK